MPPRRPVRVAAAFAVCVAIVTASTGIAAADDEAAAGPGAATVAIDVLMGRGTPAGAHARMPLFSAVRVGGETRPWSLSVGMTREIRPYGRTYGVAFTLPGIVRSTDGSATIDTGGRLSPWGQLRFHLRPEHTTVRRTPCASETASTGVLRSLRVGEPGFDLHPHAGRFHEVVRSRMQGLFLHLTQRLDGGCGGGGPPRPTCFTTAGIGTAVDRRFDFEAVRLHGGGVQMLAGYEGRRLGPGLPLETVEIGTYPGGRRFPNSHFWTAQDGSAVMVKGARGGPFPGRIRFTPSQAPRNEGTKRCRQYFEQGRPRGTLDVRFDVYGTREVRGKLFASMTLQSNGSPAPVSAPAASGSDLRSLFASPVRSAASTAALARMLAAGRAPLDALSLLPTR